MEKLTKLNYYCHNNNISDFYWYAYENANYIPKSYIDEYEKLYEIYKNNTLKDNTTIYLTPLTKLPSFKVQNYINENKLNIKKARTLSKINAVVVSDEFIKESYTNTEKVSIVPYSFIMENPIYQKYTDYSNTRNGRIKTAEITHFFINEKVLQNLISLDLKFNEILINYPLQEIKIVDNFHGNKKAIDNVEFFKQLIDNIKKYNLEIIFDININEVINKDVIIDIDIYENMLNMLLSTDVGNYEIAKEIMANCEFEASKPYLVYLYNFFPILKKVSTNTNYEFIRKKLKKYSTDIYTSRGEYPSFNTFLPRLISKNPEYSNEYMKCFAKHLNIIFKKDIIKEIITI